MYKAVRAFVRFSKYPETRPYRWRAFRAQSARWWVTLAHLVCLSPLVAALAVLFPFWWLFEKIEARNFPWLLDGLQDRTENWWRKEHDELHSIYMKAIEKDQP